MKKRILLISRSLYVPFTLDKSYMEQDTAGTTGAEVIKFYLKRKNPEWDVNVLETRSLVSQNEVLEVIENYQPDLVGLSLYAWNTKWFLSLNDRIKKLGIPVFIGGPNSRRFLEEDLPENCIFASIGEGEEVTPESVYEFLESGRVVDKQGIVTKTQKTTEAVCFGGFGEDCNSYIPEILSNYNPLIRYNGSYQQVTWELSRGCPYSCTYCVWSKARNGKKVVSASLERIEKEFDFLLSHGIYHLYVVDATFNYDIKRAKEILKILYKKCVEYDAVNALHILFEARAEFIDEELAFLMSKLPNIEFELGIQSLNTDTQISINRYYNEEKLKKGIEYLNKYNVKYTVDLICMLPNETVKSFIEGIGYSIVNLGIRTLSINRFHIYPGMKLWETRDSFVDEEEIDGEMGELHYVLGTKTISKEEYSSEIIPFLKKIMELSYSIIDTNENYEWNKVVLNKSIQLKNNIDPVNWAYIPAGNVIRDLYLNSGTEDFYQFIMKENEGVL